MYAPLWGLGGSRDGKLGGAFMATIK